MTRERATHARGRRALVVEDNDSLRRGIVRALAGHFREVEEEADSDRAVERLRDPGVEAYDVVVTDLRLPGAGGISVLRAARESEERTAILLMTAYGTVEDAVEAMRLGAFDFLQKPFELSELEARVERALAHHQLVSEVTELREGKLPRRARDRILGSSPKLLEAVQLAERVAPTRSTVLVTGETGTGKELIAGLVHESSDRATGPFVKVNCAALPETLLESELFGHERGAFTSADRLRIGRFEQADGGTLFLDEVGDMSLATQAKLLRVLQDQRFQRLGGSRVLHADVRIVTATNRDLREAIELGDFREDLFFRLNVIGIELPPLRDRPDDVEALALHFVREFARESHRQVRGFTEAARRTLRQHSWPGNVRELRNVLERAVLLAQGEELHPSDLGLLEPARQGNPWRPGLPSGGLPLAEIERAVLFEALERSGYVQKEAALLLGVSRRKLNYMVQKMGITHPSWRINRSIE